MASAERSEVATATNEAEGTPRTAAEPAKGTQESGSRLGLKEVTNFTGGLALAGVRKRSAGSLGQRAKPSQQKQNLRDFFYESKVHSPDGGKRDDGTLELVEAAKEEGIDGWTESGPDEMRPSGSAEKKKDDGGETMYTRLFTAQNEHHSNHRTFRRTQSQYEEVILHSRKRPSIDGDDKPSDEATERKRSCAIVIADDSTVDVEPEGDDDVFEGATSPVSLHLSMFEKEGSPMSEGHAVMHHRANFERTLSASVLERGEFAPPLKDHPHLPALPNIEYALPLVPTKECQVHSVAFGCISAHTLAAEMERLGLDEFHRKYVLIDCRYPYEYEGGHIRNAINLHDNAGLPSLFFPSESILDRVGSSSSTSSVDSSSSSSRDVEKTRKKKGGETEAEAEQPVPPPHRRIPVFYCEYSQKRGPTMAHDLRSIDRRRNIDRYPDIDYDVMYLLECGYRNFYNTFNESKAKLFSHHCGYVEMKQEKKQLGKFKQHRKRGRARQVQQAETASVMSPTTPGLPNKEGRRASAVAREKIRETLGSRLGGAKARLAFDSEDEKSPVKKKETAAPPKETDL